MGIADAGLPIESIISVNQTITDIHTGSFSVLIADSSLTGDFDIPEASPTPVISLDELREHA